MLSDRPQNKSASSIPEPIFSKKCRRTTWFWLIALICISIWMFFLGLLIGRGTLPFLHNPTQSELIAQGTREVPDKPVSETAPVVTRIKFFEALKGSDLSEEDLPELPYETDTEVLSVSETPPLAPAPESAPAPKPETVAAAKPPTGTAPKPATTEAPKPAPAPAPKPEVPKPAPAPAPKPASSVSAPVSGKWTLQIMATKSEAEAQTMAKKLSEKGYTAHLQKADIPGKGIMYRVQVGNYANRLEAEATLQKLQKDGYAPIIKAP